MDQLVDKIFEIDLNDIENFNFPMNELFGLKIIHNNTKYCFLIRFSTKNNELICMGSGAQDRSEKNFDRPVFQRHSWHSKFNASVIYYSDPIFLESNIAKCGWCVGTPEEYYLEYIKKIIEKLCINRHIKNENILFYGSSAGGFTSIKLGTYFKESKVLVNNPQIDVRNFNKEYYDTLLKVCFRNMDNKYVEREFSERLDVFSSFKKEKYIPKLYYIIELYSDVDFKNNLIPFLKEINKLNIANSTNAIQILFYNENGFHTPLNKTETIKLINTMSGDLKITLNNMKNVKLLDQIKFSIPDDFEDGEIPTENKLKFINEKNEEILIHEYSKNNKLSEKIFHNQITSLKNKGHVILVKDTFIINKIKVFMIKFQDSNGKHTFFYFDKFNNSYLAVLYNFTSIYYEIELIKYIINNMKKEKVFIKF